MTDDSCCFLAADFGEANWREDAKAFMQSCREISISAALEISHSSNGIHIWIFLAEPVPAREARQLGASLISHTWQLSLTSYSVSVFDCIDLLNKRELHHPEKKERDRLPTQDGPSI